MEKNRIVQSLHTHTHIEGEKKREKTLDATMNAKAPPRVVGILFLALVVVATAAAAARTRTLPMPALPFSGAPTLAYGVPFYIYSAQWQSYCRVYFGSELTAGMVCDIGVPMSAMATQFTITGGNGSIPSSATTASNIGVYRPVIRGMWCFVPRADPTATMWCNLGLPLQPQFRFSNYEQPADGWLRGGTSMVRFDNVMSETPGKWCSMPQRGSNGGRTQCNGTAPDASAAFYFVPA